MGNGYFPSPSVATPEGSSDDTAQLQEGTSTIDWEVLRSFCSSELEQIDNIEKTIEMVKTHKTFILGVSEMGQSTPHDIERLEFRLYLNEISRLRNSLQDVVNLAHSKSLQQRRRCRPPSFNQIKVSIPAPAQLEARLSAQLRARKRVLVNK